VICCVVHEGHQAAEYPSARPFACGRFRPWLKQDAASTDHSALAAPPLCCVKCGCAAGRGLPGVCVCSDSAIPSVREGHAECHSAEGRVQRAQQPYTPFQHVRRLPGVACEERLECGVRGTESVARPASRQPASRGSCVCGLHRGRAVVAADHLAGGAGGNHSPGGDNDACRVSVVGRRAHRASTWALCSIHAARRSVRQRHRGRRGADVC
jgi:hypothetical protein